ncbi:MAG: DUF58 domain-containing protein [Treponema sp.]|nr:DUF58 domain-containing protein [Treponema sp.]
MALPRFRLFPTPFGGAVLIIALIGLVRSLVNRNSYEVVIFSAALFLMLVLWITGVWKSKKLNSLEPGWKTPFPVTANDAQNKTQITGLSDSIPLFFRQHFILRGRFFPDGKIPDETSKAFSKNSCSLSIEVSVPRKETTAQLPLCFPMSGIFLGDGYCQLRDIFGFFFFKCGQPQRRTLNVRCAPCIGREILINAQTGAEDQRSKPAADIERYYMREYSPGDRFRDINWKSSDKIDTLITRISTDNQEKVNRLEIHFRNYRAQRTGISLEELWLLDRAKARLSYFLRSLMEKSASLVFDIRTAGGSFEIRDLDELDTFFEDLAVISFLPPKNEMTAQTGTGDIYVFSTACDTGLPSFLINYSQRPVNLFIVQPAEKTIKENANTEIEALSGGDFYLKGLGPAVRWFAGGKTKILKVQANRIEMFFAQAAFLRRVQSNSASALPEGKPAQAALLENKL